MPHIASLYQNILPARFFRLIIAQAFRTLQSIDTAGPTADKKWSFLS